jgi:hypothetical protein
MHVACTLEVDRTTTMYLDGVVVGTSAMTGPLDTAPTAGLAIGRDNPDGDQLLNIRSRTPGMWM